MQTVLRLLCLASLITGGIKAKTLENIKRELLQVGVFRFVRLSREWKMAEVLLG